MAAKVGGRYCRIGTSSAACRAGAVRERGPPARTGQPDRKATRRGRRRTRVESDEYLLDRKVPVREDRRPQPLWPPEQARRGGGLQLDDLHPLMLRGDQPAFANAVV